MLTKVIFNILFYKTATNKYIELFKHILSVLRKQTPSDLEIV